MVSNRCWSVMINKMSGRVRGILLELAEQPSKALVNAHWKSGPEGSGPHCKTQARKVDSPGRPSRERGRVRQCSGAFGFLFSKAHNHEQAKLKRSSSSFLGGPELVACQAGGVVERVGNLRGEAATWPAWRMLERLDSQQSGTTDLNAALSVSARYLRGAGLTVVVSDLFSPGGYQQGIDALLSRRQDVLLVQLLSPDEMEPPADLIGEWRLLDSEAFAPVEATITPGVLKAYRRLLTTFSNEAADFCRRRGITFVQLRSDVRLHRIHRPGFDRFSRRPRNPL